MPSLNFKKEFVGKIEAGEKRQTIREDVPFWRRLKAGDKLYLFTGLRTKNCRVIVAPNGFTYMYGLSDVLENPTLASGEHNGKYVKGKRPYVECKSVEELVIDEEYSNEIMKELTGMSISYHVWINGDMIFDHNTFAQDDGFKNYNEFVNFFKTTYGLPFKGLLIKW